MTYKVKISTTKNPVIFQAMLNLVNSLKERVDRFDYDHVAPILKSEYEIILHPITYKEETDSGYHIVEFASKRDFTVFILRWS